MLKPAGRSGPLIDFIALFWVQLVRDRTTNLVFPLWIHNRMFAAVRRVCSIYGGRESADILQLDLPVTCGNERSSPKKNDGPSKLFHCHCSDTDTSSSVVPGWKFRQGKFPPREIRGGNFPVKFRLPRQNLFCVRLASNAHCPSR